MINVKVIGDVDLDYEDVIRRSPVSAFPWALKHLRNSAETSACAYVGFIDGEVACVYGLVPPSLMSDKVYLWLLTTDTVDKHKFVFIRHSQMVIERVLWDYDHIFGETIISDEKAIRWLRWLGAVYLPPQNGLRAFYITKETFARRNG